MKRSWRGAIEAGQVSNEIDTGQCHQGPGGRELHRWAEVGVACQGDTCSRNWKAENWREVR